MDMKKYVDIERFKEKYALVFTKGEHITITEKVDGANASIRFDGEKLVAFSRRQMLGESNTLQGFYNFVQTLDAAIVGAVLGTRYILFGEWLVKHTIKYPDSVMKQFYAFDVWDTETEQYVPWEKTKQIVESVGLKTVPLFYDGPFTTWEDVTKLVGKTEMGGEPTGEGIVIKSQDRLDNKYSGTPAYVKIVSAEFSEVHMSKPTNVDPEKLAARQAAQERAESIVTKRRITKGLEKFVEDNLIPSDWDEHDMSTIARNLPRAIYNDCIKEEPETVSQIENFGKICGTLTMKHVRDILNEHS